MPQLCAKCIREVRACTTSSFRQSIHWFAIQSKRPHTANKPSIYIRAQIQVYILAKNKMNIMNVDVTSATVTKKLCAA